MPASLAGSCAGIVATTPEGTVLGMGRVVGDGAFFVYLQDIAVDPQPEGSGIGREITGRLLAQVRVIAGGDAFVGLFATEAGATLYRRAGFDDQTQMRGMWQIVRTP
jgi:ribosomal protein S18 acetylase RimI-like enzyme